MEQRYALVRADGTVENVVLWDGEAQWSPPTGLEAVAAEPAVSVGWRLADGVWAAPAEEGA